MHISVDSLVVYKKMAVEAEATLAGVRKVYLVLLQNHLARKSEGDSAAAKQQIAIDSATLHKLLVALPPIQTQLNEAYELLTAFDDVGSAEATETAFLVDTYYYLLSSTRTLNSLYAWLQEEMESMSAGSVSLRVLLLRELQNKLRYVQDAILVSTPADSIVYPSSLIILIQEYLNDMSLTLNILLERVSTFSADDQAALKQYHSRFDALNKLLQTTPLLAKDLRATVEKFD